MVVHEFTGTDCRWASWHCIVRALLKSGKSVNFPDVAPEELYLAEDGRWDRRRMLRHYVRSVCVGRRPPKSGRRLCPHGGSQWIWDPTWRNPSLRRAGAEATYVRQGRTDYEIPCFRHLLGLWRQKVKKSPDKQSRFSSASSCMSVHWNKSVFTSTHSNLDNSDSIL